MLDHFMHMDNTMQFNFHNDKICNYGPYVRLAPIPDRLSFEIKLLLYVHKVKDIPSLPNIRRRPSLSSFLGEK